jgi:hypothetical protein
VLTRRPRTQREPGAVITAAAIVHLLKESRHVRGATTPLTIKIVVARRLRAMLHGNLGRGRDEDYSPPPAQIRRALLTHRPPPSGFATKEGAGPNPNIDSPTPPRAA